MEIKKKGNRLLAVITATVLLFSGMTAVAAEKPAKSENPTWQDAYDLMDYVGETVYEQVDEWIDEEDVSSEVPYFASGTILASAPKEQAYCVYTEGEGVFVEANHKDGETALTEEEKTAYEAFYAAGIALAESVKTADGTKYVDDIIGLFDSFWDNKNTPLAQMVENETIIVVETEEDAPDTASMNKGTYWVLASDLDAYWSATEAEGTKSESWWPQGDGRFLSTRQEVLNSIDALNAAYNTLLDKLHEGTVETSAPAKPLEKISSAPAASQKDETSAPVLVNEVVLAGGAKKQSTIEGVYSKNFMAGTIYTDEPKTLKQAAGLSEKEIADGVAVKSFICTSRNKAVNKMLTGAVSEQGYKVLGIMNNDLYKLAKGTVTKIRTTGEEISVVLGIPENLRSDQYEFVIMCYDENGALVVMPDTDNDKATITVKAKNFGYWAVGYRVKQ